MTGLATWHFRGTEDAGEGKHPWHLGLVREESKTGVLGWIRWHFYFHFHFHLGGSAAKSLSLFFTWQRHGGVICFYSMQRYKCSNHIKNRPKSGNSRKQYFILLTFVLFLLFLCRPQLEAAQERDHCNCQFIRNCCQMGSIYKLSTPFLVNSLPISYFRSIFLTTFWRSMMPCPWRFTLKHCFEYTTNLLFIFLHMAGAETCFRFVVFLPKRVFM